MQRNRKAEKQEPPKKNKTCRKKKNIKKHSFCNVPMAFSTVDSGPL